MLKRQLGSFHLVEAEVVNRIILEKTISLMEKQNIYNTYWLQVSFTAIITL